MSLLKCILKIIQGCDCKISILCCISISKASKQPHEPLGALGPTLVVIYAHQDLPSEWLFVLPIALSAVPCSEL